VNVLNGFVSLLQPSTCNMLQQGLTNARRQVTMKPGTSWLDLTPTQQILIKFYIQAFFENMSKNSNFIKIQQQWVLYSNTFLNLWHYLVIFFSDWEIFQTKVVKKIKTNILRSINFFSENCALYKPKHAHTYTETNM
jgi:hypothetical protein